ncbi:MAG: hypothetical protein HC799_13850 [Limnothrix sp. RL_2_0]|nr:hypothetical protein [Limnothrix sp. RL_2_0]
MSESELSTIDIAQISTLIGDRLGLCFGEKELYRLPKQLAGQMEQFELENHGEYYQRLATTESILAPIWQGLIAVLTNTESCFFRDEGQFKLLRTQILPELIRRDRLKDSSRFGVPVARRGKKLTPWRSY